MAQLHSISVNGVVYELPTINQLSGQLQSLAQAMENTGITAQEMTNAIIRMNEALSRLEYHANEITAIKDDLHDLKYETENIQSGLDCRTAMLEMKISDLRPELDALIEKSNQKTDLEISRQKGTRRLLPIIEDRIIPIDTKDLDEWYENFVKELGYE